jgi:hypothetical protein
VKFYSHLVNIEEVLVELDTLDLSASEKKHLSELLDANLHNTILDAVLAELSDKDKELFLKHLASDQHDKIWELLNDKVDSIEDKIKLAGESLKKEVHKDIKEAKGK